MNQRWVDVSKGDVKSPNYRTSIIASKIENKMHKEGGDLAAYEWYSGMQPLEVFKALKHLVSMRSTTTRTSGEEWINKSNAEKTKVDGRASHAWRDDYGQHPTEKKEKFEWGASNPALFFHKENGVPGDVHVDVFGFTMPEKWEKWLDEVQSKNDFETTGGSSPVFDEKQSERYQQYLGLDAHHVKQLIKEVELVAGGHDSRGPFQSRDYQERA